MNRRVTRRRRVPSLSADLLNVTHVSQKVKFRLFKGKSASKRAYVLRYFERSLRNVFLLHVDLMLILDCAKLSKILSIVS